MRIIYLHQYFNTPEDRGGTRSYEMARRLVEWGHEVHMVTSDRREGSRFSGWRQRTVEGIQVYERAIPYSNSSSYRQRIRAFVTFAVASARLAWDRTVAGEVLRTSEISASVRASAREMLKRKGLKIAT